MDLGREERIAPTLDKPTQQIKTPAETGGSIFEEGITFAGRPAGRPVRASGSAADSADQASTGRLAGRPVRASGSAAGSAGRSDLDCSRS